MSTTRSRMSALAQLIATREAGKYALPDALVRAYEAVQQAQQPPPAPDGAFHVEDAADRALAALEAGEPADLNDLADRVQRSAASTARYGVAEQIAAAVHERATERAVNVAADHYAEVIGGHLQPAHARLLEEAAQHAATLAGHPLDTASVIRAPAKVRGAWTALVDLAQRLDVLHAANVKAARAAAVAPENDGDGEFATFRDARALTGTPAPGARPQPLDLPADPVERMVWLIGPGAAAGPWLPSVAQRDARWLEVYGHAAEQRRARAVAARSIGSGGLLPQAG